MQEISERLTTTIVPMGTVRELGTRSAAVVTSGSDDPAFTARLAEVLASVTTRFLAAYVSAGSGVSYRQLRNELAAGTSAPWCIPFSLAPRELAQGSIR